mgnify:CR=1 FL=1
MEAKGYLAGTLVVKYLGGGTDHVDDTIGIRRDG